MTQYCKVMFLSKLVTYVVPLNTTQRFKTQYCKVMFLSKLVTCVVPLNTACSTLQVIRALLEMSCKIMTSGLIRTMAEMYPTAVQSVVSFPIYITAESAYSTLQVSYLRLSHITETIETGYVLLPCNLCCRYFTCEHTIP